MPYHIYTTRGIVLGSHPSREADRLYAILTEDLGLVRARAGGVRLEKSKLRGMLEPFSLVRVSLVRGKGEWRITSAELVRALAHGPELARPFSLLEKLVAGEEPHPELFRAIEALLESGDPGAETQMVARILYHLGYLREEDLGLAPRELVLAINRSLRETHLL
jgi:DNA repair protein RecO (recombination protein O)